MILFSQHLFHGLVSDPLVRAGVPHEPDLLHHPSLLLYQEVFGENCPRIRTQALYSGPPLHLFGLLHRLTRNLHLHGQPRQTALQRYPFLTQKSQNWQSTPSWSLSESYSSSWPTRMKYTKKWSLITTKYRRRSALNKKSRVLSPPSGSGCSPTSQDKSSAKSKADSSTTSTMGRSATPFK